MATWYSHHQASDWPRPFLIPLVIAHVYTILHIRGYWPSTNRHHFCFVFFLCGGLQRCFSLHSFVIVLVILHACTHTTYMSCGLHILYYICSYYTILYTYTYTVLHVQYMHAYTILHIWSACYRAVVPSIRLLSHYYTYQVHHITTHITTHIKCGLPCCCSLHPVIVPIVILSSIRLLSHYYTYEVHHITTH